MKNGDGAAYVETGCSRFYGRAVQVASIKPVLKAPTDSALEAMI